MDLMYLLTREVQTLDATCQSTTCGEGERMAHADRPGAVKSECELAWTEGPEECEQGHRRSTWCTKEQEYMVIKTTSTKSRRKAITKFE